MGLPVWITKAGDLGTIAEREFYQFHLDATDSDQPINPELTFSLVAGRLPDGISLKTNGLIEGVPDKNTTLLQGVPLDVDQDITSRFAVRATTPSGRVSDRTFTITVTGQNPPVITSNLYDLGSYLDGTYFEYQLEAEDLDLNDTLTWKLLSGELPPGVVLDNDGLINGYIEPLIPVDSSLPPGFDISAFDMAPWDFAGQSISKYYKFSVTVTDGKDYDIREYAIYAVSKNSCSADNTDLLASDGYVTVDNDTRRRPVLIRPRSDLGFVLHDNYYAFKFNGRDWDGDRIMYKAFVEQGLGFDQTPFSSTPFSPGTLYLPPNLTVDPESGWVYGYIARQSETQKTYTFGIQAVKADFVDPVTGEYQYASDTHFANITVITDYLRLIQWITPNDLGTIDNGAISELKVEAINPLGLELTYQLKSGATGTLPRGLKLLENGLIVGRASFSSFFLDGNTTTFDGRNTTFDNTYNFTVTARSDLSIVNVEKTFTITVLGTNLEPYENLYLVSRTSEKDRAYVKSLFDNQEIFDPELIYRAQDPYFGISRDLRFLLCYGLEPDQVENYINALETNHYTKNLKFGDTGYARALDQNGDVRYEVVYVGILDDAKNSKGVSVPDTINTSTGLTLHPNSFSNMQHALNRAVGQVNADVLPRWMTSKQSDGSILNYVHVCVLAYVVSGAGEKVSFNLRRYINNDRFDFGNIKFDVDRYVWDTNLSKNFDKETGKFNFSFETTFDAGSPAVNDTVFDGGGTKFFSFNDVYQVPNEDDKYLKFPKIGVL